MKLKQKKPPKKPSQLIRLALRDLARVEKDPRYVVNMGFWHGRSDQQPTKCAVCFAGSIIAKTLNSAPLDDLGVGSFGYLWTRAFGALDEFREGRVSAGLHEFDGHGSDSAITERVEVIPYNMSPAKFKKGMEGIALILEARGQ